MNREIKFRGKSKKTDNMQIVYGWGCYTDENGRSFIIDDIGNFIEVEEIEQFTGLFDKNGFEIYSEDYLGDWLVKWGSGKYILYNISTGDIIDCNEQNTQKKEITGNSFEHPREHKAMASDL